MENHGTSRSMNPCYAATDPCPPQRQSVPHAKLNHSNQARITKAAAATHARLPAAWCTEPDKSAALVVATGAGDALSPVSVVLLPDATVLLEPELLELFEAKAPAKTNMKTSVLSRPEMPVERTLADRAAALVVAAAALLLLLPDVELVDEVMLELVLEAVELPAELFEAAATATKATRSKLRRPAMMRVIGDLLTSHCTDYEFYTQVLT
eukprot:TRINITY_DN81487_c0_g1_i1.p1 TRINITY_DN81487_c0_g1~~TRINITY_DN81487_c0_g1_i1.p1  ORF type:complete len:210 (+),score=37.03 TRINITY_DN81487_c0_g1_i1:323-952(+)